MVVSVRNYEKIMQDIEDDLRARGITPGWLSRRSNASYWLLAAFQTPCASMTREICPVASIERQRRYRGEEEETVGNVDAELLAMLDCAREGYAYEGVSRLPSKLTPANTRRLRGEGEEEALIARTSGRNVVLSSPWMTEGEEGRAIRLTAAQRGSAVHRFIEKADLSLCTSTEAVREQAAMLCGQGVLTEEERDAIRADMILGFTQSPWGQRLQQAEVIREYEFSALFSPKELELGSYEDEQILMNGIIDMLLIEEKGLTILDFKTDRIGLGGEEEAVQKHRLQVEIYARAAEKIFGRPVREKLVFFLRTGKGQPV